MSVWKLVRQDTGAAVELPQDMRWTDEFEWSAVAQTTPVYSLSGAVLVQQGLKLAGRPISLEGEWVWHGLSTLRTLRDWSDIPGLQLTLTHYDGRSFNVIFRLHDKVFGQVEPVHYATPEEDGDRYTFGILLMTV